MKKELFDYKNRKYETVLYTPNWKRRYVAEAKIIKKIFGNKVEIEHVGSTSVPGMAGKFCIDILVMTKNQKIVKEKIPLMEKAGFVHRGAFVKKGAILFTRIKDGSIKTNIHFLKYTDPHAKEMLDLRDYLRKSKIEVENYSKLKKELQKKYPNNYAKYRKFKDEYMEKLKERVLKKNR